MWDVTLCHHSTLAGIKFLLTHPVWDVTPIAKVWVMTKSISTHTSRVGCDSARYTKRWRTIYFYSHIPCGMWRYWLADANTWRWISTHTSRVGCDRDIIDNQNNNANFYSHIPCGMWRNYTQTVCWNLEFLLTHPVWDVTVYAIIVEIWSTWFLLTHPVWDVTL